jgi:flagellar protein FlbD
MINVTRLNDTDVIINAELIEHIEPGVDTVISLTNGTSFVVKESWQEVIKRVIAYKQKIAGGPVQASPPD